MVQKIYKTKPLECWQKAKELRQKHYQDIMTAKERGKFLVTGSAPPLPLTCGITDIVFFGGEPWGATIAHVPELSTQCLDAAEAKGFARDLCSYCRNYLGSMFLDRSPFGTFPKPDFCFTRHGCETHSKWYQLVQEYFDIPSFVIDVPIGSPIERMKPRIEYMTAQCHEYVEWLEKTTNRRFDDERMIAAIRNDWNATKLWGEIALLNAAIPAPLDQRLIYTLYVIGILQRYEKETVKFYEMLRDEVKDRVANQIGILATERCRVMHDSQPPWSSLRLFKHLEEYGAVCIGSQYSLMLGGAYEEQDGNLVPARTPDDNGVIIESRDQAIRSMVEWYLKQSSFYITHSPTLRIHDTLQMVRQLKADGMIIHLNRGCEGAAYGQMELRLSLLRAGIPVVTYEGNMADKREYDEAEALNRIDALMESMGLKKLASD